LLGLPILVFLSVLLRGFFQRKQIKALPAPDRGAIRAAVLASGANWLVLIAGAIVITAIQDSMYSEIPLLLKLWLVLPIIAVLAGVFLLLRTFSVWKGGLLGGIWARLRFTLVTLSALFMVWFYWFWNILGFQYLA
jgi:hypothetical protein